jgi:hypothetical protein
VLRLLDEVDVPMRAAVANRLADYPEAPHAVLLRLARDIPAVATPVLERAKSLTQAELLGIVGQFGESHASIIAAREEFSAPKPAARRDQPRATPVDLSDLFFAADAADRRLILLNLDFAPIVPAAPLPDDEAAEIAGRLEMNALARNTREFITVLKQAFRLSDLQTVRIAQDRSGEPFLVAAKALDMSAAMLQRIILFLNPKVGQSVRRVYELATLYDEITQLAGLSMVSIWQAASAARKPQHQPQHYDDERARARSAANPAARTAGSARRSESTDPRQPRRA